MTLTQLSAATFNIWTVSQKRKQDTWLLITTSANVDRFSKLLQRRLHEETLGASIVKIFPSPLSQHKYDFHLLFHCNYVTILHHFQNITTFTAFMTACDLENSFSIDISTWYLTLKWPMRFNACVYLSQIIYVIFSEICKLEKSQTAEVTFKGTQGHWR